MSFIITNNLGVNENSVPCTLGINVPNAKKMRFGNTPQEAALSEWLPYSDSKYWFLRGESTGDGTGAVYPMCARSVFGQFMLDDEEETIVNLKADEPPRIATAAKNVLYPQIESIGDYRSSDYIIQQDFKDWPEFWVSYEDQPYRGNIFYPLSHTQEDINTGYVWSDDSRWRIDAPETPNSILAMLVYFKWMNRQDIVSSRSQTFDFSGKQIQFGLRGDNLDLKGGHCHFWVENEYGRWHRTANNLVIGTTSWENQSITLDATPANWTRTYDRYGTSPSLNLSIISSWGFSFIGFPRGVPVTGKFMLSHFYAKVV